MTPPAAVVPDLLRARAEADRSSVALRVGALEVLTLGQWEERSNAASRGLAARQVRPGDRVGLLFDERRWAGYAVAYLAVLKAGAVAVPLGARFAGRELERVLAHSEPVGLVGADDTAGPGAWELEELGRGQSPETFQVPVGQGDLAEILYTSGTTGTPKGVACSHGNLLAHDVPAEAAADERLSFLHGFPIGTQAGQEALRVPLRVAGRTAVALPAFDPEVLCALVAEHRIVRLQLVPATAEVLVASGAARRHDVSPVRRIVLSSAHAPPALFGRLARAFPGASLWNAYALTEAGAARTMARWDPAKPHSVGPPVGATEIRIAGPDGEALPPGEVGEVWLRRRGAPSRAYFRDPEASAGVFVDGWVRSGDLGHLDGDGHLHLDDRAKDVIISGGMNISPVEVEDALYEHPDVVEAAVFGAAHPMVGEDVAAAVVTRAPVPARQLQDHVRARLAEHKVPRRLVLVDHLPRNASGKVVKGELRRRYGREQPAAAYVAPGAGVEALVAEIWAEVLSLRQVGADDDFFALGGHSLAAAQIAARLADALGATVPLDLVFAAPTVAELARALEAPSNPSSVPTSGP